jgi:hypothetical protein
MQRGSRCGVASFRQRSSESVGRFRHPRCSLERVALPTQVHQSSNEREPSGERSSGPHVSEKARASTRKRPPGGSTHVSALSRPGPRGHEVKWAENRVTGLISFSFSFLFLNSVFFSL